ncbi:hypothetical protein ROLI_016280 [Roseobacter fucihabitans]|uniref:HEPN AbiU2-like domain-containing protein n=1 Tax=Roseobacter fucihabitans TaxID=1537242 RepID=A0ABZ2BRD3_9RHOB
MTEKSKAGCLQIIGDISIQWSKVEDELKAILWYYVGTDRQVFDVLFGKSRGRDIEDILVSVAKIREPVAVASDDIKLAVQRVRVLRRNRNTILHQMRHSHVDDIEELHPKLSGALWAVDVHRIWMIVAAIEMRVLKLWSVLHERMAMPLFSFILPK